MEAKKHRTACPRNCYSTCTFNAWVKGNKLINIEPESLNKATPEGICLKGLSYVERANSTERILNPLKRTTKGFVDISWEEAIDTIAEKIKILQKEYGSQSILFYAASGTSGLLNRLSTRFWKLIGGTTTVYGNLCWPAGLEAGRLMLGENKHNIAWDIARAKLIILWGKNPAETNIQQMIPIRKAQENSAKLVVVDPRRTESSERADMLIQPQPGTDGLLALALAKILIERDMIDVEFIRKYVFGFEAFNRSLEEISLEKASKICGVSGDMIEKMAIMMGRLRPMTLVPGYGMQRFSNGGQTTRCLLALSVITGNIAKPGACWHYADLQGDIFSSVKEPESYYPTDKKTVFRRSISTAKLGEDMMKQTGPPLKMAWIERGNPVSQNPDSPKVIEALRKLEFRVVVDQFLTDTALEADLILPAKNMFEQSDIISSYWNPYVQLKPKILEPPEGVKTELEIYRLLANKLGYDTVTIDKHFPDNDDESIMAWLEKELSDFPDLDMAQLKKAPQIAPGLQEIAFSDMIFRTPSGKIELYSKTAKEKWGIDELPRYVPLTAADSRFPFHLMSPNTKNRIHSQFGNLKVIQAVTDEPIVVISVKDAAEKNISSDELVRVFNQKGSIITKAKLDASLRPGVVVVCNGYWHQEGACPNKLTSGLETDIGHGTAFHDTMVNLEKL